MQLGINDWRRRPGIYARDQRSDGGGGRRTWVPYPGSATSRRRRRREKDPGSRPAIYNPQKSVVKKEI
jgi:hypothetical protein